MLDCGFNGYQLPVVPRACRSPRGRGAMTKRFVKNQRHEVEILARVAKKCSDERESRASLDPLSLETEDDEEETEEKSRGFFVSNFLDTMEVEVEPISFVGRERTSPVSLSKDWLALGPSKANCSMTQVDCRVDEPSSREEDEIDKKTRNWKIISGSKIGGKRKLCNPKERGWSEPKSRETQSMYPFKKRKLFHQQSHRSESRDSPPKNVKFSIKSFKIPELSVDIPVSATVGSLKMTVMEALTQILKDGLKVGVLLRGKNVADDSKTLIQTGIPRDDNHGSVGFTLEPRKPETAVTAPETRIGVARRVENTAAAAVSIVPVRIKPISRSETVRRRIRRPFTVSEVESLVQAVEKLGTGRWRDVKSHAFDHANHRTYVDLKDKWKTLVHTAKISPRQRRGEPVPQELLDRVLTAHAFWSDRHFDFKAQTLSPRKRLL